MSVFLWKFAMKKLIILSGSSNCGKSETLKLLVRKLGGKLTQKYDDRYVCNKGKLKVAICTPGDNEYIANLNISFFNQNKKCDVFISAARSSGATVNLLVDWANANKIDYIYVTKSRLEDKNNNFHFFNDKFADFLNSLI